MPNERDARLKSKAAISPRWTMPTGTPRAMETERLSARHKMDVPFLVMGLMFMAQAFAEYMFPEDLGGNRLVVKLLCGAQVAFALLASFLSRHTNRPLRPSAISVALFLLCAWLCIVGMIQATDRKVMLYACVMFLYWYSMFLFCSARVQSDANRGWIFLVVLVSSLPVWLLSLEHSITVAMEESGRSADLQLQNYLSYYMVALFPYVLLLKSKMLKTIATAVIAFGCVYSLKRGAVIALACMGLGASLVYILVLCSGGKRRTGVVALATLWCVGIVAGGLFVYANPGAVERRLTQDTGRQDIYHETIESIARSNLVDLVIGHGYFGNLPGARVAPHNDWLLLQYDYGIIGVLLMLGVYYAVFRLLWKLCRARSPLAISLASSLALLACIQMYSMGLYIKTFAFVTGSIGLVAGCVHGSCQAE